jgi:hypothetical protein
VDVGVGGDIAGGDEDLADLFRHLVDALATAAELDLLEDLLLGLVVQPCFFEGLIERRADVAQGSFLSPSWT